METWMNQTWWLYDLTVLAILVLCVWGGWQRGIIRTIAGLLGYGMAGLLAGILAQPAADYVYDHWVAEKCATMLEQKMEEYNLAGTVQQAMAAYGIQLDDAQLQAIATHPEQSADQLYTAASEKTGIPTEMLKQGLTQTFDSTVLQTYTGLPSWMTNALTPQNESASQTQNRVAQTAALLLTGDNAGAANALTEQYVRPVVVQLVKIFMFSVLFLLISAVLQVIIKWMSYLRHADGIHLADQTVGAAIGGLQAILFLVLMGKLTGWLVEHGDGQLAFFNDAVIEKTILFQGIYQMMG